MQTKRLAKLLIKKYADAWITRNPDAIVKIFTNDAKYYEGGLSRPFVGSDGIRKYWIKKVVGEESNIKFRLLNLYEEGNTAIAEWDASFKLVGEMKRIHIREVAILKLRGGRIAELREYWDSEKL
jgi:ketosteroid isomerase-like protein